MNWPRWIDVPYNLAMAVETLEKKKYKSLKELLMLFWLHTYLQWFQYTWNFSFFQSCFSHYQVNTWLLFNALLSGIFFLSWNINFRTFFPRQFCHDFLNLLSINIPDNNFLLLVIGVRTLWFYSVLRLIQSIFRLCPSNMANNLQLKNPQFNSWQSW